MEPISQTDSESSDWHVENIYHPSNESILKAFVASFSKPMVPSLVLTAEERAFYLKIEAESRSQFKAYDAAGTVGLNYNIIGSMLQRLCQACHHPLLVKKSGSESANNDEQSLYDIFQNDYISSKIRASLEMIRSEGPKKAVIFSQCTRMLKLYEMSLKQLCIQYRRLDASMSPVSRDTAVKQFNSDPQVVIMLMPFKLGNVVDDLNVVSLAASHVILLDVWWDPDTEDEAIDRAHRIMQTRPVTVSRVTIYDTIEERFLTLQEYMREFQYDSSFVADHRLTEQGLRYLFTGICNRLDS